MADITKKEIEELLSAQTDTILNAVDNRLAKTESRFEKEMEEIRMAIRDLTLTIDNMLKRVTDYEGEMIIMRAKLDKITSFIKQKFGVEISAQ